MILLHFIFLFHFLFLAESLPEFCQNKPNGNYPFREDCTGFIFCLNECTNIINCPKNFYFNSNSLEKYCDIFENSDCYTNENTTSITRTTTEIPLTPIQTTKDGPDYTTTDGSNQTTTDGSTETTKDGSIQSTTDSSFQTTTDRHIYSTTDGSIETTTNWSYYSTTDGTIVTQTDLPIISSSATIISTTNYPETKSTPKQETTRYSEATTTTVRTERTTTINEKLCGTIPNPPIEFTCEGKFGDYGNPNNCCSYITCQGEQMHTRECPAGLHWDWNQPQNGVGNCEYPNEANCPIFQY